MGQVSGLTPGWSSPGPVTQGLDLGSWLLPSSLPTHQAQVSSWQAPWHAERGRRATVTPLSECHVTAWHPLSREAWHMLGHDCDLQTDQTLGEAPRAAISAFYHQHRQGELASDTEWRAQGFWGRCGSNSIKYCHCPLCFTASNCVKTIKIR